LSAWSRSAVARFPTAPDSSRPDTATKFAAMLSELPGRGNIIARGAWVGGVPLAARTLERPAAAQLIVGSPLAGVYSIGPLLAASHKSTDVLFEARFWDWDSDGRPELIAGADSERGKWYGLFELRPLVEPSETMKPRLELSFWARHAGTLAEATASFASVPRRGLTSRQALDLLRASRTGKDYRANSTPDAELMTFGGWVDPVLPEARPLQTRKREKVEGGELSWLPDGSNDAVDARCLSLVCETDCPHCYCLARDGGGFHRFWFAWNGDRPLIAGIGRVTD
jgi:hypothetical protein